MDVEYADKRLEKTCTNEREMRKRRADIADKLRLRIKALETADSLTHLVSHDPLGDWHELTADRGGQWSGRLSRNHRLIIRPTLNDDGEDAVLVTVIEITDYHSR